MAEHLKSKLSEQKDIISIIIGILVCGSIWGLFEATLGGFLNLIIFPNKGAIMSGIGMVIMSVALAIYRKPAMLPAIGLVAASFKLLNVWLLFVPIHTVYIINPAMAIIFESLAFSLVAVFLMNRMAKNASYGIAAGVLAGLISAAAWVYYAIYVMNAPAYARVVFTAGGFIANQGVAQAIFLGVFLPLGYRLGEKLATTTFPVLTHRSLYYVTSTAVICFCWGVSVIARIAGL